MPAEKQLILDARNVVDMLVEYEHPGAPILVLAHGAGNDMDSPFLNHIAGGLMEEGINPIRFRFPYRTAGRKIPDREPTLRKAWLAVIAEVQRSWPESPLFIGGKSMGGRIASLIALDVEPLRGLVFLGYPLHPPGKPDQLRDAHLYEIRKPMLFIQGERDPFAKLDLLEAVLRKLGKQARLHLVESADHSLKPLAKSKLDYPTILRSVSQTIARWIQQVMSE